MIDNRPSLSDMEKKFRRTKLLACVGSTALTLAMIPLWPLITLADGVMDLQAFTRWVRHRSRFYTLVSSYPFNNAAAFVASPAADHVYKLAVLTCKVRSTSTPVYLHDRITERVCSRTLRSSATPQLVQPFTRTDFSRRVFRFSAPSLWNSLPQTILISDSLSILESRLKTFLLTHAFTEH